LNIHDANRTLRLRIQILHTDIVSDYCLMTYKAGYVEWIAWSLHSELNVGFG